MSEALSEMSAAVKTVLEEHLPRVAVEMGERDGEVWEMPTLEDFVCVFAVADVGDGRGSVGTVQHAGRMMYRRLGLLEQALMDLQADMVRGE